MTGPRIYRAGNAGDQGKSPRLISVDFGTTNTHIEYKYGVNAEKAIDVTPDLPMWQSLIDRTREETRDLADDNNFEREIFPYQFNSGTNYRFPFRTALTYNQNINFNAPFDVFTHTNNFFLFEKLFNPGYLQLHTKLKWSNYSKREDKVLVESYIEGLMYMVYYKTLLLDGDPQKTKITWFYPVSMDAFEQGIFFDVWQKAYKKIFRTKDKENIMAVPESIAPYLSLPDCLARTESLTRHRRGIVRYCCLQECQQLAEFISSFKFAGNAIFGDGFPYGAFANSSDNNGFVKAARKRIESTIQKGSQREQILLDILENRKDYCRFQQLPLLTRK